MLFAKIRAARKQALDPGKGEFLLTLKVPPEISRYRHANATRSLTYRCSVVAEDTGYGVAEPVSS